LQIFADAEFQHSKFKESNGYNKMCQKIFESSQIFANQLRNFGSTSVLWLPVLWLQHQKQTWVPEA